MQKQPLSQRTVGESTPPHNQDSQGVFDLRLRITGTAVTVLATAIAGVIAAVLKVLI